MTIVLSEVLETQKMLSDQENACKGDDKTYPWTSKCKK